jgi:hypothetical protein
LVCIMRLYSSKGTWVEGYVRQMSVKTFLERQDDLPPFFPSFLSFDSLTAARCTTPALFTTTSSPPNVSVHISTALCQSSPFVASPVKGTATALSRDSLREAATRLPFSAWISKSRTRAPSATNLRAMPSPSPRPAPVMIAVLLARRPWEVDMVVVGSERRGGGLMVSDN